MWLVMLANGAAAYQETSGFFCSNCLDVESARQQALQYAPSLDCNSREVLQNPAVPLTCSSVERRVVLGNHVTGAIFAFVVSRGDEAPWAAVARSVVLDSTEAEVYSTIVALRSDWDKALERGAVIDPEQGIHNERRSCPSGTALDHVLDPAGQAAIEEMITADVAENLEDYMDASPWYRSGFGVGVTVLGTGGSLQFPDDGNQGHSIYSVTFPQSEVATPNFDDVLVYELELLGVDRGQPLLTIDFVEGASRVAGARLDLLKSADVEISNECVLEKLGRLDDTGGREIRQNGVAIDPEATFGAGASVSGAPGGVRMCVYDFYVNGRYQFSFAAPCDAIKDKEEIKE
jgi:hypothetical protein